MRTIRLGAGAGFSGDRIDPAVDLARNGEIDYLIFECLAERTIALAQQAKMRDPSQGYDPLLAERMLAVLPDCRRKGIRIITNMGAANPLAAAQKVRAVARQLGLAGLKIAAVMGDDVLDQVMAGDYSVMETDEPVQAFRDRLISANAYLGAGPILRALQEGADVVITGRASDPALFLAPLIHEFGWGKEDWTRLGRGILVGHLLECAGQITGGYFADPHYKDVPDLARLGMPIGEVSEDGTVVITKTPGSGGKVSAATCKEQLLYEIHDPRRYFQPDVVADFSNVTMEEIGPDRVRISGADGSPKTKLLKVSLGYVDSYVGEGQISYAGPGAVERGKLALRIIEERLRLTGLRCKEMRSELIGVDSILGGHLSSAAPMPAEVRARIAGRTESLEDAQRIAQEVDALYLNGPAGGGGVSKSAREIIGIVSTLIPEDVARTSVEMMES
ncbi:acyclic terpene utilization AtuA family protein [Telmatospirillum sp. J64-1]|uniref:acyclic terpene utilization AtuA family protein n=1 Tax=Telmatospirillum sp. J64-1 TaxID=2502183 RepID=UPI00115EFD56|nr:acyclic terpene utilization AtuA family protein [Telmatospirillum sp. J64-1]